MEKKIKCRVPKDETPVTWETLGAMLSIGIVLALVFCLGRYIFPKQDGSVSCAVSFPIYLK